MDYRVHPIPAAVLDDVRASGVDAAGNPVEAVRASGDEPLRCCLRDAGAGEELILFGYRPPLPPGPYQEVGPVFAHAARCAGPVDDGYPADWRDRPQVLRAYDHQGRIHPATTRHEGAHQDALITDILADLEVAQVHSRNTAYGCYMFAITRRD